MPGGYQSPLLPSDPRDRYTLSDLYYDGEVYRQINENMLPSLMSDLKGEKIRELENPTEQAVEFHAAHLFPGMLPDALPLRSDNLARIGPAIRTIWKESNWNFNKQVYARWLPLYADAFLKAAQRPSDRAPFMQLTHPSIVTDFEKDDPGNLIWIWLETEVEKNDGGLVVRNETWDLATGMRRIWYASAYGSEWEDRTLVDTDEIDDPQANTQKAIESFGIDFLPFVHAVFMPDLKDPKGRGVSAIARKVAQVDELNRMVSTIHDRYFRYGKPDKAVMAGESGRTAPRLERNDSRPSLARSSVDGSTMITEDGEKLYRFPGMTHMEYLVANLPYLEGLELIRARQKRLSENWAELRYFEDVDQGDPSGVARRNRLAPAISRTTEARGNAEEAMIRCQKMCLTLGSVASVEGFEDIGTFDAGDFEHEFTPREIMPRSEEEEQGALALRLENAARMRALGRSQPEIVKFLGWTDDATPPQEPQTTVAGEQPGVEDPEQPGGGALNDLSARLAARFNGGTQQGGE